MRPGVLTQAQPIATGNSALVSPRLVRRNIILVLIAPPDTFRDVKNNPVAPFLSIQALTFAVVLAAAAQLAPSAQSAPAIQLKLVAEKLTAPIALTPAGDGSGNHFIADQSGLLRLLAKDGSLVEQPVLDLRPKLVPLNAGMDERGLIGFAPHPDFKTNRKIYTVYSAPRRAEAPKEWDHTMRLSEFRVTVTGAWTVDAASERVVLEIDEPMWNHNSGRIAFGPDGFLYWTVGDGGAPNDVGLGHAPEGNGQNLNTLFGKILRIDVNKSEGYGIPRDNPYADGKAGRPEIFAYGLRNPWGISFDRGGSRELFVADVGQESWEEVNIIQKGGNYGWRVREGLVCFDPEKPMEPPVNCPTVGADGKPFIDPVIIYKNFRKYAKDPEGRGLCITGGYVYRGKAFPALVGKYVFADWTRTWGLGNGALYIATRPSSPESKLWTMELLAPPGRADGGVGAFVWAMGEDEEGEIYVLTNGANMVAGARGKVFKLVPP